MKKEYSFSKGIRGKFSRRNKAQKANLKRRLRKDRPMTAITVRMPDDVIEDLKRIAPTLGFSGYQPLLRHYIGQGLRADLERLEDPRVEKLVESLKRHGVSDSIINDALEEAVG